MLTVGGHAQPRLRVFTGVSDSGQLRVLTGGGYAQPKVRLVAGGLDSR